MKKRILLISLVVLLTTSINSLMAQPPGGGGGGDRGSREAKPEMVDELSLEQILVVNKILSKYDSDALSEDDAKAIMSALREGKVPPGKGLESAIGDAGFDFEKLKELAPPPSKENKKY